MNKRMRQYIGLIVAIILYYVVHEGTHFLYALFIGAFKNVNIMGLGMQIDIYVEKMTQTQLGVFCLLGSIATIIIAYVLVVLIDKIGKLSSSVLKTCAYYTTIAMLCIDPLYLSLLCGFFGGGDMNGIALLMPELIARIIYAAIFVINAIVFAKIVLPKYKLMFSENEEGDS